MKAVVRLTDVCTGHGCFPSRENASASTHAFIEGLGVHRVGDAWNTHCCPPVCHDSVQGTGSDFVFFEGKAVARISDNIACGGTNATGSDFVFCE